jgi:uncharacterized protein YuzE
LHIVAVGSYEFDDVRYDSDCDVLCLRLRGTRGTAAEIIDTPEGHLVYLSQDGEVTGVTLISAKSLIESDGKIPVTFPRLIEPDLAHLAQVLGG